MYDLAHESLKILFWQNCYTSLALTVVSCLWRRMLLTEQWRPQLLNLNQIRQYSWAIYVKGTNRLRLGTLHVHWLLSVTGYCGIFKIEGIKSEWYVLVFLESRPYMYRVIELTMLTESSAYVFVFRWSSDFFCEQMSMKSWNFVSYWNVSYSLPNAAVTCPVTVSTVVWPHHVAIAFVTMRTDWHVRLRALLCPCHYFKLVTWIEVVKMTDTTLIVCKRSCRIWLQYYNCPRVFDRVLILTERFGNLIISWRAGPRGYVASWLLLFLKIYSRICGVLTAYDSLSVIL